jgi:elongation factor Ts
MAKSELEKIKQLRKLTHISMMECKKALEQTGGDIEKAVEELRKRGARVAAKRAGNETNHGVVASFVNSSYTTGALATVTCETDFAANTADMQSFSKNVAKSLVESNCDYEKLLSDESSILSLAMTTDGKKTIGMHLEELIAKISEKIKVFKIVMFEAKKGEFISSYIHSGATIGAMVRLCVEGNIDKNKDLIVGLAKDICMQIVVTKPLCTDPSQLDESLVNKEKEIIKELLVKEGKPEAMIEKIMAGKINKYYEDVCLIKQKYIKDDKLSIEKYVEQVAKQAEMKISIKEYSLCAAGIK